MSSEVSGSTSTPVYYPMVSDEHRCKFERIVNFIKTSVYIISPEGNSMHSIDYVSQEHVGEVVDQGLLAGSRYLGGSGTGFVSTNVSTVKGFIQKMIPNATVVHSLRKQIFTMSPNLIGVAQNWDQFKTNKNFKRIAFLEEYEVIGIDSEDAFVAKINEVFNEILSIHPVQTPLQMFISNYCSLL